MTWAAERKAMEMTKKHEEVVQELVNGAKKLLSFESVKNVFICKVPPPQDLITLKWMKHYSSLITVNLLSDVERVNIIDSIRCEMRLFNKDGIHLNRRGLSLQAKIMVNKLCSVINQSDVKTSKF